MLRAKFTKLSRLLTCSEFQNVFADGKRSTDRYFAVFAVRNHTLNPRLGLVVSRKCSKKAVERNHLKRVIREYFRSIQHEITNLDLIIVGRRQSIDVKSDKLQSSLKKHFARLNGIYAKLDNTIA